MKKQDRIYCHVCLNEIDKSKDSYFDIDLYSNGSLIKTEYAHVSCHNQNPANALLKQFSGIAEGLQNQMQNLGMDRVVDLR